MGASRGHGQYPAPPQSCTSIGTHPRMNGPGASHRFFQSSVSALRASRTLLCTTTGAFDPGRGYSSPPGLEPLAIQTNNHQRRVADLGDLFFYPDSRGDPAYVSLSFLENRPNVPRAALRSALGLPHFAPLGRWGSMVHRAIPEAKSQTSHALGGTFRGP